MMNETGNSENTNFADEAKSGGFGVKDLGRKSLGPLIEVITRHKTDFSPYLSALTKALRSGADSLTREDATEADRFISQYFTEGADWLTQWKDKLHVNSKEEFLHLLEEEGKKRPAILFGASYFAGMILGRFGRHLGKTLRPGEQLH